MNIYFNQLMPILLPMGGGGDPDYALGGLIWVNIILILYYICRAIRLRNVRPFFKEFFRDRDEDFWFPTVAHIAFFTINGMAILIVGAGYITDHFIK